MEEATKTQSFVSYPSGHNVLIGQPSYRRKLWKSFYMDTISFSHTLEYQQMVQNIGDNSDRHSWYPSLQQSTTDRNQDIKVNSGVSQRDVSREMITFDRKRTSIITALEDEQTISTTTGGMHRDSIGEVNFRNAVADRERWPSRVSFSLAVIGACLGIVNVFDLPVLAMQYDGAAFFVPLISWYCLLGVPLLRLELALGQVGQGGTIKGFEMLTRFSRGFGVAACFLAFAEACLRLTTTTLILRYFFSSFQTPLPWSESETQLECEQYDDEDACNSQPRCFFPNEEGYYRCIAIPLYRSYEYYIHIVSPEGINGISVAALLIVCLILFFFLFHGIFFLGHVTTVVLCMLVFLLFVLAGAFTQMALNHEATMIIVTRLFNHFDLDPLLYGWDLWGIMGSMVVRNFLCISGALYAMASYTPVGQNVFADAEWIVFSNFACSVMFTAIYFCAYDVLRLQEVNPITYDRAPYGKGPVHWESEGILRYWGNEYLAIKYGVSPTEIVYAACLALFSSPQIYCALFYFAVFTIGLMTVVAYCEALITTLNDSRFFSSVRRLRIVLVLCILLFIFALSTIGKDNKIYTQWMGSFINQLCIPALMLFQCVAAGWIYGIKEEIQQLQTTRSLIVAPILIVLGAICAGVFWQVEPTRQFYGYEFSYDFFFGLCMIALGLIIGLFASTIICPSSVPWKTRFYWLSYGSVNRLKTDLNNVIAGDASWHRLSCVWCLSIRYVIPVFCIVQLTREVTYYIYSTITSTDGKNPFSVIPATWAVAALFFTASIVFTTFSGVVAPNMWRWISPPASRIWQIWDVPHKPKKVKRILSAKATRFYEGMLPIWLIMPWPKQLYGNSRLMVPSPLVMGGAGTANEPASITNEPASTTNEPASTTNEPASTTNLLAKNDGLTEKKKNDDGDRFESS